MPEYLTPGVYVEETSFRSRSIEGVATSTFGMAGLTRYGPVPYLRRRPPTDGADRRPVWSPASPSSSGPSAAWSSRRRHRLPTTWRYAARAFFDNGGRRLYVARVFRSRRDRPPAQSTLDGELRRAARAGTAGAARGATWRARWPGAAAAEISVRSRFRRSKNMLSCGRPAAGRRSRVRPPAQRSSWLADADGARHAAPAASPATSASSAGDDRPARSATRAAGTVDRPPVAATTAAFHLTLSSHRRAGATASTSTPGWSSTARSTSAVDLHRCCRPRTRPTSSPGLARRGPTRPAPRPPRRSCWPALLSAGQRRSLPDRRQPTATSCTPRRSLGGDRPTRTTPPSRPPGWPRSARSTTSRSSPARTPCDLDRRGRSKTGGRQPHRALRAAAATGSAIVDPPERQLDLARCGSSARSSTPSTPRSTTRGWRSSTRRAKPDPGAPPAAARRCRRPGSSAGIYARSDIERGVHKAPANEVVLGITKFVHQRHLRPAVGAQPRGHQRAAVLRGPRPTGSGARAR